MKNIPGNSDSSFISSPAPVCYFLSTDERFNIIVSSNSFKLLQHKLQVRSANFYEIFFPEDKKDYVNRPAFTKNNRRTTLTTTSTNSVTIDWQIDQVKSEASGEISIEFFGTERSNPGPNGCSADHESKNILDLSIDLICVLREDGIFSKVNATANNILGYEPEELIGRNYLNLVSEQDREISEKFLNQTQNGSTLTNIENHFLHKDGSIVPLSWSLKWNRESKVFYSVARDLTNQNFTNEALRQCQEKYRILFCDHPLPAWIYDAETFCFLEVNEAAIKKYGYSREEFLKMSLADILTKKDFSRFEQTWQLNNDDLSRIKGLWAHRKKDGSVFPAEVTAGSIHYNSRKAYVVLSLDRTEHILAQQELINSNQKYLYLSESTDDAIWDMDMTTSKVSWNQAAMKMFEIEDTTVLNQPNWWSSNIHPEDKERVERNFEEHIAAGKSVWEDEYRFRTGSNNYKYIHDRGYLMFNEHGEPVRMIGGMQDLTQRKSHELMLQELNNSLEKRAKELAESNEDLERFAYVASHDLQEPLRMVTSFLQLLEKRYKDKLDKKAHEYIAYAVDGAERMKKLILDLLEYSSVNASSVKKEEVDAGEILNQLKVTYKAVLQETKGTISYKKMPVVLANRTQLTQLFQNLIGNAFKYTGDEPPVIQISCEEEKSLYRFAVADNGIGIAPKFFSKIFIIFQRLHNREKYTGTGIGLAICKKIIDKHGGKIWVTSAPGQGSTFYFTLPKS